MKLKLLLLLMLIGGMLNAQDTIRTFIITETRVDRNDQSYVELTNVGEDDLDISQFEFGRVGAWTVPYETTAENFLRLPEVTLAPGQTYVMAAVKEFVEEMHPIKPDLFQRRITKPEWWDLADMVIHMPEDNVRYATAGISDSISPNWGIMETWGSRETWYIEQHFENGDSAIVDQVGGLFAEDNDTQEDSPSIDVAGVTNAWGTHILVRKASIKEGTTDFDAARGIDIDDSEWIPIPVFINDHEPYRAVFWTTGFHGDVTLDENTLQSDVLEVDWANKTITAPWGVRNNDDFMFQFEKVNGLAWKYDLSEARADSAYNSARTGDKLTIYACGNTLQTETFDIIVEEPMADANILLPKYAPDWDPEGSFYSNNINSGNDEYYSVTVDAPEMDTITNGLFGIGYATRTDSLLTYLEKAPEADWEFVWVDGVERPDVKNGDILRVTADNGDVKDYFIKVNKYIPSHNADLSSITWPDIPEDLKGLYGWVEDTIPGFNSGVTNYNLELQYGIEQIPTLIGKISDLNSTMEVNRAISLDGSDEQKTIDFVVTAEDDTTQKTYSVKMEKPKDLENIQPFEAEPFISELVMRDQWANGFVEICNPGNQTLDLSNYMFVATGADISNPAEAIESFSTEEDWLDRYSKYVPGYKWVDQTTWGVSPGMLVQDLAVSSMVAPGDVFVMGEINGTGQSGETWFASEQCDVIFNTDRNPWGEEIGGGTAAEQWLDGNFFIFKILNDSILTNDKPANDPNDFELIEYFGQSGETWVVGGITTDQITTYIRKPEYYIGKTEPAESFGATEEESEWIQRNRAYYQGQGFGWPDDILQVTNNLGQHYFNEPTGYQTTVTSVYYKVSEGFSMEETIIGVYEGTTVEDFLSKIEKKYQEQVLVVKSGADGSELAVDELVSTNDTLVVTPAIGNAMTKYILDVTEEGLNSDAYLTSSLYTITTEVEPKSTGTEATGSGTITGFEYGTQLRTVVNNVDVPDGATFSILDDKGAPVPLKRMNFDTAYVDVTVNHLTYFEVVSEDNLYTMMYQLLPQASQSSAFVTSDVYNVQQSDLLIQFVPRGTTVDAFMSNILPSLGSTVKLIDKLGNERVAGNIAEDDKLIVTAPDGETQTVYYLAMLRTELVPAPNYLAYVLSDVYTVDQQDMFLVGSSLTGNTLVADFHNNIEAVFGATAIVMDKDGNEKTDGDLDDGDWLKVISADGKIEVMYALDLDLTSADKLAKGEILLYPNPTTGTVNINGLEKGTRLQVFNQVGAMVNDIKSSRSIERISLENQPAGMYLIVLTKDAQLVGQYKVIRK
ncbi:Por secretion system C-terminal sorting domain-containing protein [Tangfeifania diversioriginum]|uniref:Por secretion system C-terminal sorting domain-containing protein n=1 Tax=Tangfeifania diversioriginum TaxID=1168035 RepID=A0A1M6BTA4_9BACT|nr:T9SS type A sorting domain-containing protein [Tangfeifania diversioriginum]SHI51966.1 Por secretion system C-terminal sorting domain-containing protein [Tangfeifania diversioriginum]